MYVSYKFYCIWVPLIRIFAIYPKGCHFIGFMMMAHNNRSMLNSNRNNFFKDLLYFIWRCRCCNIDIMNISFKNQVSNTNTYKIRLIAMIYSCLLLLYSLFNLF